MRPSTCVHATRIIESSGKVFCQCRAVATWAKQVPVPFSRCELCQHYRAKDDAIETDKPSRVCVHMGDRLDLIPLSCCSSIETRACSVHGECVEASEAWNSLRGMRARDNDTRRAKCCERCDDKRATDPQ